MGPHRLCMCVCIHKCVCMCVYCIQRSNWVHLVLLLHTCVGMSTWDWLVYQWFVPWENWFSLFHPPLIVCISVYWWMRSIHIGKQAVVVTVQILFRWTYCWEFMDEISLSYLESSISLQASWSSGSNNLSPLHIFLLSLGIRVALQIYQLRLNSPQSLIPCIGTSFVFM